MNIVITFNYHDKRKYGAVSDEFDTPQTIDIIKNSIIKDGHQAILIEADENFYLELKKLKDDNKVDLVFNYSVGIYGISRETHIPAICEMLRVPYASSDVLATAICADKARTNDILNFHGIKTPAHQLFSNGDELLTKKINYPVIVKYVYQGSSIGLQDDKSVVDNEIDLHARVQKLYQEIQQPIMAEEYIRGREFTVGFCGNYPEINLFPLVEILALKTQDPSNWVFNSHQQPVSNKVIIEKDVEDKIHSICEQTIKIINLRDWGRIDLRVEAGTPYIIEVNNCAHLSTTSVYLSGAKAAGLTHEQLIDKMLNSALKRYQLIK